MVFIRDFRRLLFTSPNPAYCGDLCDEVMRYMNSSFPSIRSKARALASPEETCPAPRD